MLKKLCAAIVFICVPFSGFALTGEQVQKAEIGHMETINAAEKNIPELVARYATSIGCNFEMNHNNIVRIGEQEAFVVLFWLDADCSGGSAMSRPVLAIVKEGAFNQLFVDVGHSTPKQTSSELPQNMERIFNQDGQLGYEAKVFGSHDGLCCPSINVSGSLCLKDGIWIKKPESPDQSASETNTSQSPGIQRRVHHKFRPITSLLCP